MAAPEIPKTQKALIYDQPGTVSAKIVDLEVPEPGSGEVLINLYVCRNVSVTKKSNKSSTHSGVCHSDLGVMTNTWSLLPFPTQPGQVGGHEGVGKVVKLGPGTESSNLKIGDRVGVKWVSSACGHCRTY
jgi:propanol-preferring alcohol dehydrogenase